MIKSNSQNYCYHGRVALTKAMFFTTRLLLDGWAEVVRALFKVMEVLKVFQTLCPPSPTNLTQT